MADNKSDATYVLGRSEAEERRLERQSQFLYPFTRGFFEDAGLSSGMNVLDIGSGAGDVSLLAANIVGPDARVTGVDMNAEILNTARERARASGHQNVNFVAGDIRELSFDEQFDAVIGRLVLIYLKDAGAVLRHAVSFLRPGGLVAFQEIDFSSLLTLRTVPPSPLGEIGLSGGFIRHFSRPAPKWIWGSRYRGFFARLGCRIRRFTDKY